MGEKLKQVGAMKRDGSEHSMSGSRCFASGNFSAEENV